MDATHTIAHLDPNRLHDAEYPAQRRDEVAARLDEEAIDYVPLRAIVVGVVLGSALWVLIFAAAWLIFH